MPEELTIHARTADELTARDLVALINDPQAANAWLARVDTAFDQRDAALTYVQTQRDEADAELAAARVEADTTRAVAENIAACVRAEADKVREAADAIMARTRSEAVAVELQREELARRLLAVAQRERAVSKLEAAL